MSQHAMQPSAARSRAPAGAAAPRNAVPAERGVPRYLRWRVDPHGVAGAPVRAAENEAERSAQGEGRTRSNGGTDGIGASSSGLDAVREVIASAGRPLDAPMREAMQEQLGRDLGDVRIHTDASAARSADALAARAYAVGGHVVFGAGEYAPNSAAGRGLIAHELAHTASGKLRMPGTLSLGALDDPSEREAERAAQHSATHADAAGWSPPAPAADAGVVRRAPKDPAANDMGAKTAQLSACRIRFKFARAELEDAKEFDRCMKAARAYLKTADPSAVVLLYGFASDEGSVSFNQTLSEDRARTVAKLFGMGGVDKARVQWFGYGADAHYPKLEDNRRVEVVPLAQQSMPPATIEGTRPGPVPFPAVIEEEGGTPEDLFAASIASAESLGLPVKFLRAVQAGYTVTEGSASADDATNTVLNRITFRPGVMSRSLDVTNPGKAPAFGTLYHEPTHAYIEDLVSDVEPYASARRIAEVYYRGAPVGEEGKITTDPSRLAAEAGAEYVDHRINVWWMTYTALAAKASKGKLSAEALAKIRDSYNTKMKKQDFGYSEERGEQLHTSTSMNASLMRVLDESLLEGKLPKDFDQVEAFKKIVDAAKAKNQLPP